MQSNVGDGSWPELPGTVGSNKGCRGKTVKKFSHVAKKENNIPNVDGEESDAQLRERELEHFCHEKINVWQTQKNINAKFEKKSPELKQEDQNNFIKKQILKETEKEKPIDGLESRNRTNKQLLREEKKRAKEEEIRRNLVAPKGQKVRVVDQKMLETLLNNNVSFVNRQAIIPTLTETDFPSVEEAGKQRVKSNVSNVERQNEGVPVIKRIKKRKDPLYVNLVNLIKKKPERQHCGTGRIQKRDGLTSYSGNPLDASKPERKRGKMKEVPKKKKPSALKCAILEERALRRRLKLITNAIDNLSIENKGEQVHLPIHSRKFREYCENRLTPRLNEAMKLLLRDIVKFQDRQHQKNPVKAFAKRRYVSGFREVKKQLTFKKVKLVVIAPDLEIAKNEGGIDEAVAELKATAKEQNVMCAFALSRRELGYLTFKKVGISCIGICNYEGSESNYQEVVAALAEAQENYQLEKNSISSGNESDTTSKLVSSLLSKLSKSESPFLNAIEKNCKSEEEREMLGEQQIQTADE